MNEKQEKRRLAEVKKYNIIDSPTDPAFEEIAKKIAGICETPISLITIIDEDTQWHKVAYGTALKKLHRAHSFCNHALQNPKEVMIVEDARKDIRFQTNPIVVQEPNVVFYAGVPLVNRFGYGIGAICVMDTKPRFLTVAQLKALQVCAVQIMHLIEVRYIKEEKKTIASATSVKDGVSINSVEKEIEQIKDLKEINFDKMRLAEASSQIEKIITLEIENLLSDRCLCG